MTDMYRPSMVALGDKRVGKSSLIPRRPGEMARAQMMLVASATSTIHQQAVFVVSDEGAYLR